MRFSFSSLTAPSSRETGSDFDVLFFLLLFLFIFTLPVSAHTFKTDGSITVLQHSNPDDDPIAGQANALLFGVTDTAGKFKESECACTIVISHKDQTLLSTNLLRFGSSSSLYSFTIPFAFPARAVYGIDIAGTPKTAGAFQPFKVHFDLRVDRIATSSADSPVADSSNQNYLLLAGTLLAIILASGIGMSLQKKP